MWVSTSPGTTVSPAPSITSVPGPTCARTSTSSPTARSTPSRQATAVADGRLSSSVWTVAPRMAPSAECAGMRTSCHRARPMISHWFAQLDPPPVPRPALPGSRDADVCIVGAGFTGLWTAYELRRADPGLDVVVLEAEVAGFGASGRNGGWGVGEL